MTLAARIDRTDRVVLGLGLTLLAAYVVQARLDVAWPLLARAQADDTFKVISGSLLAGYLLVQSALATRRLVDPRGAIVRHKVMGACAPAVLYLHAARPGYGYLLVLAVSYLGLAAIGLLHGQIVKRARALFAAWFIVHVTLAAFLLVLTAYHVVIALAYE